MSKNVSLELDSRPTFEPLNPGGLPEGHLVKLYRFGHL